MYKPINLFSAFIIFTLMISFWGPLEYVKYDKVLIAIFMTAFLFVCYTGYYFGVNKRIIRVNPTVHKNDKIIKLVKRCIGIYFIFMIFTLIYSALQGKINLSLSDLGRNYVDYYSEKREVVEKSYSLQTILFFFMDFPKVISLTLGFYYYKLLSKNLKLKLWSIVVLTLIVTTISIGNQKSLSEIVIYLIIVLFIKSLDYSKQKRRKLHHIILMTVALFLFIVSMMQYQRIDTRGIDVTDLNSHSSSLKHINFDHWIFQILPLPLASGLTIILTGYISAGYYGLSLCMQLPFVWTYGIGSSYSMSQLFKILNIIDVTNDTYLMRMESAYDWKGLALWNSIFPWIASDLTFVGAILIFIPIAYIFAICWKEVYLYRNPISIVMFAVLATGAIFVPANNQLFHGVNGYIGMVILIIFWFKNHKRYNYIEPKEL